MRLQQVTYRLKDGSRTVLVNYSPTASTALVEIFRFHQKTLSVCLPCTVTPTPVEAEQLAAVAIAALVEKITSD